MAESLDHVVVTNVSAPARAGDPPMDPERVWYLLGFFLDACLPSVRAQTVPHTWLVWFDDRADPDLVAEVERIAEGVFTPLWRQAFDATSVADAVARHSTAPWVATTLVACDDALARDCLAEVAARHDGRGPVSVSFPQGLTIDRTGGVFATRDESSPVRALIAQRTPDRPIATVVDDALGDGAGGPREVAVVDRPMWIDVDHEPADLDPPRGRRVDGRTVSERFSIDLPYDRTMAGAALHTARRNDLRRSGRQVMRDPKLGPLATRAVRGVRSVGWSCEERLTSRPT